MAANPHNDTIRVALIRTKQGSISTVTVISKKTSKLCFQGLFAFCSSSRRNAVEKMGFSAGQPATSPTNPPTWLTPAHPLNHGLNLHRLLEVIQLVGLYPPLGGFHQQLRVVVFIGEKGIERQADVWPLAVDFVVADPDDFLP